MNAATMGAVPIQIRRLSEHAELPQIQSSGAAGMDLHSSIDATVPAHGIYLIPTGIAINIITPYLAAFVYARSGLSKQGISLANGVGVVDSDYQGQVGVLLKNSTDKDFVIKAGDRVAQMVFAPVFPVQWVEVPEFAQPTERGEGGFGSTGLST